MSPDTEHDETPVPDPGEVHLCRCGEPMTVRDAMTLGYHEVPPVYVCPKRATERGHDTWAGDLASGPSPVA
jgi:hypothetical protein